MSQRVSVLLVTHGASGDSMLAVVKDLLGGAAVDGIETLAVEIGEPRPRVMQKVHQVVERLDEGQGVLVVCDLHGTTLANCCLEEKDLHEGVVVVSGLNMAMLIKLASLDRATVTPLELARGAIETGKRSIRIEKED